MNAEERIEVVAVRIKELKCNVIRDGFSIRLQRRGLTYKSIRAFVNNFKGIGSVHDKVGRGRKRASRSSIESVRQLLEDESQTSVSWGSRRLTYQRPGRG